MGQHRPVQVFNLVTRDSIEERVLRTLDRKRTLFAGVFTDPSDEVLFATLGHQAFLDTMRQLVEEEPLPLPEEAIREGEAPAEPGVAGSAGASPSPRAAPPAQLSLASAAVQLLEALAAVGVPSLLTTDATGRPVLQMPLPPADVLQRGTAALRAILGQMGETNGSATTEHRPEAG
jgi:hypothetical protein